MNDHTSRQYISHMFSMLGMEKKAIKALSAPDDHLHIYIKLLRQFASNKNDIKEFLEFSGLA